MIEEVVPMYLREKVRKDDWENQIFDNMKSLGGILNDKR